ncbi:MAG TPA: hypothetical protein VG013_16525 [Gemmataceae bacterium]|nr:hypothetical protein [Gemmataceae bacterium]
MRRKLTQTYLTAALGAGLVLGCQSAPWRHSPSHDPLLLSKKSVDGQADTTGPVLLAQAEPAAPPVPAEALVSTPPPAPGEQKVELQTPTDQVPAAPAAVALIGTATAPPPVTPAVRPVDPAGVPAMVVSRQQVVGNYGHAPNYAWLQGVLTRHYQGHLELRYSDPRTEDHWGGKVCLEADPRLAQFADGDVILVEGALVPESGPSFLGGWHYRHYRVTQVLLIHRGK